MLEPEYTPEELASADAGLGGGGDPLIPLGKPEEQVLPDDTRWSKSS